MILKKKKHNYSIVMVAYDNGGKHLKPGIVDKRRDFWIEESKICRFELMMNFN